MSNLAGTTWIVRIELLESEESRKVRMERIVQHVLERSAMEVHFQPIVSVRRRKVVAHEALARPRSEDGRSIRPDLLFEAAAMLGKAKELDLLAQETALSSCLRQSADLSEPPLLTLNMHASHFHVTGDKGQSFWELLGKRNIDPAQVVPEVCEDEIGSPTALAGFVAECRNRGMAVALDDLGKRHSNLDRIASLHPDILKLDRLLVQGVHQDRLLQKLVRSLCALADSMGSLMLAEGVETHDDVLALMDCGVDLFQGYYFARPSPDLMDMHGMESVLQGVGEDFVVRRRTVSVRNQELRERLFAMLEQCCLRLEHMALSASGFDDALDKAFARMPGVECAFVLDKHGVQVSSTRFSSLGLDRRRNASLFEPAVPGDHHGLKEYFLGLPQPENDPTGWAKAVVHVSSEYTSLATGSTCRTASRWFSGADGEIYILCVDYTGDR